MLVQKRVALKPRTGGPRGGLEFMDLAIRWLLIAEGRRCSSALLAAVLALGMAGCGRGAPPRAPASRLPIDVLADTASGGRLAIKPPRARAWLMSAKPAAVPSIAVTLAPQNLPGPDDTSGAGAAPQSLPPAASLANPATEPDADVALRPPLLRSPGTLIVPHHARGSVELDVLVDERGRVSAARFAGGSTDSALIGAARRCALGMRFYPARRGEQPVAVWCRQRFEFGGR
jgi:hypothetical protein